MYEATTPSRASRCAFFAASASPFLRRCSMAPSRSPAEASSAALQSITPAPVRSRSSFTISADDAMPVDLRLTRRSRPGACISASVTTGRSRRRPRPLPPPPPPPSRSSPRPRGRHRRSRAVMSRMARIASSLPGIGIVDARRDRSWCRRWPRWEWRGAAPPRRRSSPSSGSMMKTADGQAVHVLDADEALCSFAPLALEPDDLLLGERARTRPSRSSRRAS